MRDRAWRRATYEKVTLRRLRAIRYKSWWFYKDANGYYVQNAILGDFIGTEYHRSKYYLSNYTKDKYSPNKSNKRGGFPRPGDSPNTREWNKRHLLNILRENGIK